MNRKAATSVPTLATSPPLARCRRGPFIPLLMAVALLIVATGCRQLRLPAIDPTGSHLFSPLPTTTTLALPGSECLQNLGQKLHDKVGKTGKHQGKQKGPKFTFPQPAFPEPEPAPPCPEPAPSAGACGQEACVPSAPCNGSCKDGPPAVLFGNECVLGARARLPKKGKRGCILLSPQKVVAPVGGEVVLLSGICGPDGYLQMNEKLEWMLTPDSVGTFIQVGDDDPGLLTRLVGSKKRPTKHDPSYALGITSTKRTLITRGNNDPRDDVQLERGQTWITISSPSEGTSRVTVLAPDSNCWDQRKATTTIYWVDARWAFPGPQNVPAGTPVELTTRVTRSEGVAARGWKVRYEILQPELATFAGTGGASVVEATVDDSGNATAQLVPTPGTSGSATINMQVIRPGGETDNLPTITLGSGQTFVTWSAPQLQLRAGAPGIATFDVPVQVVANVSNPGDQAATNVRLDVQIPPGARVTSADSFARILPNSVTWEIGDLPAQQQLDLFLEVAAQSPIELLFQARGDGLVAESAVRIDVFRPSLSMTVTPVQERVESGQQAVFNIDITNTGDRPLQNLAVTGTGDQGMIHEGGGRGARNSKDDGPLQPGQTWAAQLTFVPTQSGRRCAFFEATADAGQRATQEACLTVINPVPKTPRLEADLETPASRIAVGQNTLARIIVRNVGQGVASNVRVTMVYDPQLQLVEATEGADPTRVGQNIVTWNIPLIQPGNEVRLEGRLTAIRVNPRTRIAVTAASQEGSAVNRDLFLELIDASPTPTPPTGPTLPPVVPTPEIPGGPAPLRGAPPAAPVTPPPTGPQRSQRLQVQLFGRDNPVRVNDPIRYSLTVFNDSDQADGQVTIRFQIPPGVRLERAARVTNPELAQPDIVDDIVTLPEIPLMRPGESIEYELVLSSNQRQTFNLTVQVRSERMPNGVIQSVTTDVQL